MIDWATSTLQNHPWNGWLALGLYWLPLSLCAVGYTARTWRNFQGDVKRRAEKEPQYYSPTDTIGDLIGRAFVTLCPILNTWAAAFDVAPAMFGRFFDAIHRVFNQPLVPRRARD